MDTTGLLALVGGNEWTEGCTFDAALLEASGGKEVVVLPTAAAYQHPERVVLRAAEWFADLGGQVEGLMVVDRASANDPGMAAVVRAATSARCSRIPPPSRPWRRPGVREQWWPARRRAPWCSPIPWSTRAGARSPSG